MRVLSLLCAILSCCVSARSELYVQKSSCSPDGKVVFAINYPPTEKHPEGYAQGCFLHSKSKKLVGSFFFLPDTDEDADHPGTYTFDNYHVFDYVWSADSTHVAVTLNRRRWSRIYPFRLTSSAVQMLGMPDLYPLLEPHLAAVLQVGPYAYNQATSWTKHHRLVASITNNVRVTRSENENEDWKVYALEATISFAENGTSAIKATKFAIHDGP